MPWEEMEPYQEGISPDGKIGDLIIPLDSTDRSWQKADKVFEAEDAAQNKGQRGQSAYTSGITRNAIKLSHIYVQENS